MSGKIEVLKTAKPKSQSGARLDGVAIGVLIGFESEGVPLVAYPDNPGDSAVAARRHWFTWVC